MNFGSDFILAYDSLDYENISDEEYDVGLQVR